MTEDENAKRRQNNGRQKNTKRRINLWLILLYGKNLRYDLNR